MGADAAHPDPERVQQLLDRQDILDCLNRYCRGVDRLDEQLLRSAYHPDAIDNHGIHCGTVDEFIEWAFAGHRRSQYGHQHYIMNHSCELAGDVAHTETYMMMVGRNISGTPVTLHGGRYVDRFERRDGRWAIAYRASLVEWTGGVSEPDLPPVVRVQPGAISRDQSDISYERPLVFDGAAR
ncbi:nuclear transport factor 2 family protein [Jatrophihabitans sp.]|uniref:nuclear transport factor 2 family protein n=1 Tax=Jatrophihabitans sp. TaxID=1932789 RepID=UPI0030C72F18|nr:nuclear transport factor 2 family protein [Jatrophihabitans sp.]